MCVSVCLFTKIKWKYRLGKIGPKGHSRASVANFTCCKVYVLQSACVTKCMCCKVHFLHSLQVAKCTCYKVHMLQSAKNKVTSSLNYILHSASYTLHLKHHINLSAHNFRNLSTLDLKICFQTSIYEISENLI